MPNSLHYPRLTILLLCLLVSAPVTTHAQQQQPECQIDIAYGPYVSLMFVDRFFSQYHKAIEQELECKVDFDIFQGYDEFLQALILGEYQVTILPQAYAPTFMKEGFQAYAIIDKGIQAYALASVSSSIENIKQLEGRKVGVLHPFSGSALLFRQTLREYIPLHNVQWVSIPSYESILLAVIEKRVDAGIVIEPYYGIISKNIRERKIKTLLEMPSSPAFLMIHNQLQAIAKKLSQLLLQSPELQWHLLSGEQATGASNSAVDAYVKRIKETR